MRDVPVPIGARDDVTYLFLEDRGVPPKEARKEGDRGGEGKDVAQKPDDTKEGNKENDTMDVDAADDRPKKQRYKILAVKPATSVMPLLHSLLSPFALGLSKAARAAASTSSTPPQPTPVAGTALGLTTLAFPPTAHPLPALNLSVHILPNHAANTIFLEGEWDGGGGEAGTEVLREFLRGCVPDVPGETKFLEWDEDVGDWSGVEKTRRVTKLLAQALRESGFI